MIFTKEPNWQKDIISKISKELGIDKWVVREIAYYPLLFVKREIVDGYSERPTRIRKLGVFGLRGNSGKLKVLKDMGKDLRDNSDILWEELYTSSFKNKFESEQHFINYINYMIGQRNYSLIRLYHKELQKLL